jgi:hypothetical protein
MSTATANPDVNTYGIPKDPKEASEAVKSGALKITTDVDAVPAGAVVETFTITVKSKDKETGEETTHYTSDSQPFGWNKVNSFPGIFADQDAALTDDQVAFLGEAFPSESQGKVVLGLVKLYNDNERAKAKANEYQRVMSLYKPMSEEDRNSAVERAIDNVVKAFGLSREKAREMVLAMKG